MQPISHVDGNGIHGEIDLTLVQRALAWKEALGNAAL